MDKYNIAQINIAHAKNTMDTTEMKGFVERLDEINALADKSPGFIWRLQGEGGNATTINAFNDPLLIVNMSVWKTFESLKNYVYKSVHIELIRDRNFWFNKMSNSQLALWWIPEGKIPTVVEGKEKLIHIHKHGASKTAFTFSKYFEYES